MICSKHAVVYINTDGNERGFFGAGGTQDLQPFISARRARHQ